MAIGVLRNETVGGIVLPVPAEKIKEIRAEVRNLQVEVIRDKVIIQGILHKQIFFVDLNGVVRHIPEDVPFSTFIDVPNALPGMHAQVDVVIEHIKAELAADRRTVIQKVILQLFVKVSDEVQLSVTLNPRSPLVKAEEVIGENTKQELVSNQVTLPVPALKIADIDAEIRITDTEVITNKVIIQGVIHKQVFFIDQNNVERHIAEDVPFSTFLDIPGALPGDNVQVRATIELVKRQLNTIPGAILSQETVFEIFVKVHRTVQINVETGPGPLVKLPYVIGENTKQDLIVTDITLGAPAIKVKEIVASFRNLRAVVIKDKVVVQGTLHKQIFYVDRNNIERHQAEDVPFSNFLDVPGAETVHEADFRAIIEEVIFELRPGNILHQKVAIQYFIKVTESRQVQIRPGLGPLIKIEEVVGENTKQILIERVVPLPPTPPIPPIPPVSPINITRETIRTVAGGVQSVQRILNNSFTLPEAAIKIKSIEPMIRNVRTQALLNQVLVSGQIVKNITFVDQQNVVRNVTEIVPFEFLLEFPGVTPTTNISNLEAEIENLSFKLAPDNRRVDQTIVLKFILNSQVARQTQVITDITGPNLNVERLPVRAEVVIVPITPAGEEPGLQTFGPVPIENTLILMPPAAEIVDILATIENLRARAENGGVRFTGTVVKEVLYVAEDGVDTIRTENIPFNLFYANPAVRAEFAVPEVFAEITDIQLDLSDDGRRLSQAILLTFRFKVTQVRVINVVTAVSGPRIGQVTTTTLVLDVVGQGPRTVQVVTDVQILPAPVG